MAVRSQFINKGVLANTKDTAFRSVSDSWPVFGLAHDLGAVTGSTTVVFSLGHIREPAINYIVAGNSHQARSYYFWSKYRTTDELVLDPPRLLVLLLTNAF